MNIWQKWISYFWEVRLQKIHSPLNGNLYVNVEYGKKVLHAENANFSYQKLHTVLRRSIRHVYANIPTDGSVLNLGLGGGSSVEILREELGHSGRIISVEHDPIMVEIATNEFNIDRFENHEILVRDAMEYFGKSESDDKFNLIICDLFRDREVPEKFMTIDFMRMMIGRLMSGGYLIFNYIDDGESVPFFDDFIVDLIGEISYEKIRPVEENFVLVVWRG